MDSKRLIYLDILKVVSLFMIILAHVSPPDILFQLRNFDVVLMIIISCYLGLLTYKNNNFIDYIKKRFKRLVLPTWCFLLLFFIINVFCNFEQFGLKKIIGSFALSDVSIGFVWVIRIYFVVSLLVVIYNVFIKFFNKNQLLAISIVLFALFELLCVVGMFDNFIVQYLIAYFIPCFLLLNISQFIFDKESKLNIIILMLSIIILIVEGYILYRINGSIQPTQIMKYPFRMYYLSYGIICSYFLVFLFQNINISNKKIIK